MHGKLQKPNKTSLIEFPCHFPIKVMGKNVPEFSQVICNLMLSISPQSDAGSIEMRPSSKGNYLSLTCKVYVESQEQLDHVYRTFSSHPLVSVVL